MESLDWSDLRIFLAACRLGSASRAAVELGVSVSTVTRRLASLDAHIGRPLLVRTPSGMVPTPAGHALLPHAADVERSVVAGLASIEALQQGVEGEVVVALPSDMLLLVLLPRLRPFVDAHPDLTLAFDQGGQVADLSRREADIAVRVQIPPRGDELVASRLRAVEFAVFTRADRLAQMTNPSDPGEHDWVGWMEGAGPEAEMLEGLSGGRYAIRCSSPVTIRHAVMAGLGSALMPAIFGEIVPGLVRAPLEVSMTFQLHLITHRAIRHSPRIAAVWEELERLLRTGAADERQTLEESLALYGW